MINDNRLLPLPGSGSLDRSLHDLASPSPLSPTVAAAPGAPSEQANLRDYLNIVSKRKWLILSIMVIVTSLTAIYVYRQPSIYEARTTIQIEQKAKSFLKTAEISINAGNDPTYRNTQLKLLENPALLRQVALTLDLQNNPAFFGNGGSRGGLVTAARQVFARKEAKLNADEAGIGVISDAEEERRGNAAETFNGELTPEQLARLEPYEDALRAGLTIEPVEKTNLINIIFEHTDPQVAMNVANTIAAVFIANDLNSQTSGSQTQEQRLARQVIELQMQLQRLEARRANFMLNNDIPLGQAKGLDLTAARVDMYSSDALKAEAERKRLAASYRAAQQAADPMTIPEVLDNKSIQTMRERLGGLEEKRAALLVQYTEIHPSVQQVNDQITKLKRDIDLMARQIVAGLGSQLSTATAREREMQASYLRERGEANQQSLAALTLTSLNQELETTKQLYNIALQKQTEVRISGGDDVKSNVTIATPSREPREPVGPQRARNIILALFLSLGAGIGLSILLDHLDDTLKSVEDVDRYMHLPTLALIPAPRTERGLLKGKDREPSTNLALAGGGVGAAPHTALALIEDARSPIAEAYRHLRTSLLLSSAGQPPRTVLVTSSQPSEGKTTTAINTAVMLAQTGAEVALVDCDLRRPRIHSTLR